MAKIVNKRFLICVSSIMVLITLGIYGEPGLNSLLAFLLAGTVPGTNIGLSSTAMLIMILVVSAVALEWQFRLSDYLLNSQKNPSKKQKRLPYFVSRRQE